MSEAEQESLLSAYVVALGAFKDSDLKAAADMYLTEGQYFPPRPSDLIKLLPRPETMSEEYKLQPGTRCQKCGHWGMCIKDQDTGWQWQCRQCYTGLTVQQYNRNMQSLGKASKDTKVRFNFTTHQVETYAVEAVDDDVF